MKGIAKPRTRDRLKLAWHALFSSSRYKIEDASESVLYPPAIEKLFDEFYEYIEQTPLKIWKAHAVLGEIEKATGPCSELSYARGILSRLETLS